MFSMWQKNKAANTTHLNILIRGSCIIMMVMVTAELGGYFRFKMTYLREDSFAYDYGKSYGEGRCRK